MVSGFVGCISAVHSGLGLSSCFHLLIVFFVTLVSLMIVAVVVFLCYNKKDYVLSKAVDPCCVY